MSQETRNKLQDTNKKQETNYKLKTKMQEQRIKKYDLEDRTLEFSKRIINLIKCLPKNNINFKLSDQLVRSGTSVGANYREANDALGKKDFIHRVKIARKEAKETIYWLKLVMEANHLFKNRMQDILQEAQEIRNILSAIIKNSK